MSPQVNMSFRRIPKKSEVFRRIPQSSENVGSPSPSLRTPINTSSLPALFTSKIRDQEEGIVIHSFYKWFSFLIWIWVNIFLEIVSSKTATTHIFQSGMRNWPAGVSWLEIKVFNPQAWELAGIFDWNTEFQQTSFCQHHKASSGTWKTVSRNVKSCQISS